MVDVQVLGSPQVQDKHLAVLGQHQVVRAQVPVDEARLVDLLHGLDSGTENLLGLAPGHGAGPFQPGFQGFALHKVHDDIGGVVLPEQIPDPDDPGNIIHPGHFPGFLQEHLQPVLPGGNRRIGFGPDQGLGSGHPADLAGWVVFLNGNFSLQGDIPANVSDAEASLAQHPAHQIFPIQNGLGRKGKGVFLPLSGVIAAPRAGIPPKIFHAAQAL